MTSKMTEQQRLLDVMVDITMVVHTRRNYFKDKSVNAVGDWVREKLNNCGFKVEQLGCSHATLIE